MGKARAKVPFELQGCFRVARNATTSPLAGVELLAKEADAYFDPLRCRASCAGNYVGLLGGTTCACLGDAFSAKEYTRASPSACAACTSCFGIHTKFPCTSKTGRSEELLCDKCHPGKISCDDSCEYCGNKETCRCGSANHMAVYSLGELPRDEAAPRRLTILTPQHGHVDEHTKRRDRDRRGLQHELDDKARRVRDAHTHARKHGKPAHGRPSHDARPGPKHTAAERAEPNIRTHRSASTPNQLTSELYNHALEVVASQAHTEVAGTPAHTEAVGTPAHTEAAGTAHTEAAGTAHTEAAGMPVHKGVAKAEPPARHMKRAD